METLTFFMQNTEYYSQAHFVSKQHWKLSLLTRSGISHNVVAHCIKT
jgi:hypothetical protein